jgi:hypothetical protein
VTEDREKIRSESLYFMRFMEPGVREFCFFTTSRGKETIPTSDDVAHMVCIFQVATLQGKNLRLQLLELWLKITPDLFFHLLFLFQKSIEVLVVVQGRLHDFRLQARSLRCTTVCPNRFSERAFVVCAFRMDFVPLLAVFVLGVLYLLSRIVLKPAFLQDAKNTLLVIAHPDDEVMFFSPTLFFCGTTNIFVLCLSNGNAYGLGQVREKELLKSCATLQIPASRTAIILDSRLDDGEVWNPVDVAEYTKKYASEWNIDTVFPP